VLYTLARVHPVVGAGMGGTPPERDRRPLHSAHTSPSLCGTRLHEGQRRCFVVIGSRDCEGRAVVVCAVGVSTGAASISALMAKKWSFSAAPSIAVRPKLVSRSAPASASALMASTRPLMAAPCSAVNPSHCLRGPPPPKAGVRVDGYGILNDYEVWRLMEEAGSDAHSDGAVSVHTSYRHTRLASRGLLPLQIEAKHAGVSRGACCVISRYVPKLL
jgi:hypothetical protein